MEGEIMRSRLVVALALAVLSVFPFLAVPAARADTWARIGSAGIAGGYNLPQVQACSSAVYKGNLYVGTRSNSGCQVYRYSGAGKSWTQVAQTGFGDPDVRAATSMAVFGEGGVDHLYVGTHKQNGRCQVWRYDGSAWTKASDGALESEFNMQVSSLCSFNGVLYAGVSNVAEGCGVYALGGGAWSRVNTPGFGADTHNVDVPSMTEHDGCLAVGTTKNDNTGFWITAYDGEVWTDMVGGSASTPAGFDDAGNTSAASMTAFGPSGDLWVGTRNAGGAQIWHFDAGGMPPGWVESRNFNAENPDDVAVTGLIGFGAGAGSLYAATENWESGCELWRESGGWARVGEAGIQDAANIGFTTMARFSGALVLGTSQGFYTPDSGCMVYSYDGSEFERINASGFAANAQAAARCSASLGGKVFFGTANESTGGRIWRWDGASWSDVTPQNPPTAYTYHNRAVLSMASDGNRLYIGTYNYNGGEVWRYDPVGGVWDCLIGPGGAMALDASSTQVTSMCLSPTGRLCIGTTNDNGCEVWEKDASDHWARIAQGGFGNTDNETVGAMAVFSGKLCVGTWNYNTGCEVYRRDAGWTQLAGGASSISGGFGDPGNAGACGMAVFNSRLYVGTYNSNSGCEAWAFNGSAWSRSVDAGWGEAANESIEALHVLGGRLYAASTTEFRSGRGCQVRMLDAKGWRQVNANGFGNTDNDSVTCLASEGSRLYAATWNWKSGFEVYRGAATPRIESVSPSSVVSSGALTITGYNFGAARGASKVMFGSKEAIGYTSWTDNRLVVTVPGGLNGSLPVTIKSALGVSNARNVTVKSLPCVWYLAEGTSDWGFETYINIQNPGDTAVTARVTYMTSDGAIPRGDFTLPAASQTVINPRDDIGSADFSTRVECLEGKTIAVDRRMLWTGPGAGAQEGHSSVGVTGPSNRWYLPEGSTKWGFETWLLIQNPGNLEANCNVTYMIEGGSPKTVQKKIPANTRRSFNVADDIGEADVSILVESDRPVIGERAMYRHNRRQGHASIGTTAPAETYYLAEGSSNWGFTTYILVQNPNTSPVNVTVTYMTTQGPVDQPLLRMPARSRRTINVNEVLPDQDFSTVVSGKAPIIAERAMYWGSGTELGEACHDSIGMPEPHTRFYLPDGETQASYETFTLVQNPNPVAVSVEVRYMTPTGDGNKSVYAGVPANSRMTFNMSDEITRGRAAVLVTSMTPGRKIMVERAMYWAGRGAGTDTIGGFSD